MAVVTIDTGPITAGMRAKEVPPEKWSLLLGAWCYFCQVDVPHDCRELLRFVREAEENQMWGHLGFSNLEDMIRRGLRLDPEMVQWAVTGLSTLKPNEPLPFKVAVDAGKRAQQTIAAAPIEVGPGQGTRTDLVGEDEHPSNGRKLKEGNSVTYLAARLKRDHPELAERVLAGEFASIRAAALKAGIVKPRLQIPADIDAMAVYLRRKLTPEECSRLAALLVAAPAKDVQK